MDAEAAALEDFKKRWIEEIGRRAFAAKRRALQSHFHDPRNPNREQLANTVQRTFTSWKTIGFSTPSSERTAYITAHNALINSWQPL
jgi:hypothetical protein